MWWQSTVNDTYGHHAGDKVLKQFADILKHSSRKEDLAARWGGEEFIVLMPHTAAEKGRKLAERVRCEMENSTCPGVDRTVTVSVGVAQWEEGMSEAQDLVALADKALYSAKENGRNRVVVATDESLLGQG